MALTIRLLRSGPHTQHDLLAKAKGKGMVGGGQGLGPREAIIQIDTVCQVLEVRND